MEFRRAKFQFSLLVGCPTKWLKVELVKCLSRSETMTWLRGTMACYGVSQLYWAWMKPHSRLQSSRNFPNQVQHVTVAPPTTHIPLAKLRGSRYEASLTGAGRRWLDEQTFSFPVKSARAVCIGSLTSIFKDRVNPITVCARSYHP